MRNRFAVAVLVLVVGCAGLVFIASRPVAATQVPPKPNLVVILADDLDDGIMPIWDALPQTKARIHDQGIVFNQAFSTTPSCCPARAGLLTGKYAHSNGVWANTGIWGGIAAFQANANDSKTVAAKLAGAGYRTGLFGKYLNGYSSQPTVIPPGWSDWAVNSDDQFYDGYGYQMNVNGVLKSYGSAPKDYLTDVVADHTVNFIDAAEANDAQPFFALVSATAPHIPLVPPPRYANHQWVNATVPQTPNYYEADISDKPPWQTWAAPARSVWKTSMNGDYRNRMGSLLALDDLVVRVLDELIAKGELSNTYVMFVSDNGYNLGAHGFHDKLAPYEESIGIPMMMIGPGINPSSTNALVGLIDIMPTFLQLAGVNIPADVDGRSLVPHWTQVNPPWRQYILLEYRPATGNSVNASVSWFWAMLLDMPAYIAVRSDHEVLIRWWQDSDLAGYHDWEFYDLNTDPYQLNNLMKAPNLASYYPRLVAHAGALTALKSCQGATC